MWHSVWSFYLGQPFRMSLKGVSLGKPGLSNRSEPPGHWTPYPAMTQPFSPVAGCVEEVCAYQVLLFEAMAPLSDALYVWAAPVRGCGPLLITLLRCI